MCDCALRWAGRPVQVVPRVPGDMLPSPPPRAPVQDKWFRRWIVCPTKKTPNNKSSERKKRNHTKFFFFKLISRYIYFV